MSRQKPDFKPLSLAQYFEVPDDHIGEFAWVVGFSASADFLNDAAERFTGHTQGQRAYEGKYRLGVMLDPGNPQIAPADIPGVLHLPKDSGPKPFRLLHAKVALLGFRHQKERENWCLRLIVSTGNWTRQTLEESLDLAWVIELGRHEIEAGNDKDIKQRSADIKAAWDLVSYVRRQYDTRVLLDAPSGLEDWLETIASQGGLGKARFADNRNKSLLKQLPVMIAAHGVKKTRNHLSMGSGFYESSASGNAVPKVLDSIVKRLRNEKLLTGNAEIAIFVNPWACQAIAGAHKAIHDRGWSIRPAGEPEFFRDGQRTLHAKFLFSANWRNGSNNCTSSWVYLGSGNLTAPGFMEKMSAHRGNLEAGVVFAPDKLHWESAKLVEPRSVVSNLLPVQWGKKLGDADDLETGGDAPERGPDFLSPPVAWLDWKKDPTDDFSGWLSIPEPDPTCTFDVLCDNRACEKVADRYRWQGGQPRQVTISWTMAGQYNRVEIPVRDEAGRFAATKLPSLDLSGAVLQLMNFPNPPEDEDLRGSDSYAEEGIETTVVGSSEAVSSNYPIRRIMQLIEDIATRQTAIHSVDWKAWVVRLEQTLCQMADCNVLKEFKGLDINPLSPLWAKPFRPEFAETNQSDAGQFYESALSRVEAKWDVAGMDKLG